MEKSNDEFFGIIVYSIEPDGCLNGLWTNIANYGIIRNEIAQKENIINEINKNEIEGEYIVTYIEDDKKVYYGKLVIEKRQEKGKDFYYLKWVFNDKAEFEGKPPHNRIEYPTSG